MKLKDRFFKKHWSPWVCGALLGVVAFLSLLVAQDRLGVTGGFQTLASVIANALGIDHLGWIMFDVVKPPVFDPQIMLFVGMLVGALVAALVSHDFKVRVIPDKQWVDRFGSSVPRRWIMVFVGAALMEIGAVIAGGCTSGMGVSGTMQLSPQGVFFIIGCFGAGIATALVLYARKAK